MPGARNTWVYFTRPDYEALRRRCVNPGETCELVGVGPIPVSAVIDLINQGDVFLAAVYGVPDAEAGDRVMAAMKKARAFVLPSVCYENFPMTIVEAMACGTPVITSRTGGLPEIVQDGDCGLLFEPGSAADLTERVKMLNADEAMWQKMAHNARQRYLACYTPEENHRLLMEIYEGLST